MARDISRMISECSICLKYQCESNWEDTVDHCLFSLDPLTSSSMDTMGRLKWESINHHVIITSFQNLFYVRKQTRRPRNFSGPFTMDINFGDLKDILAYGGSHLINNNLIYILTEL